MSDLSPADADPAAPGFETVRLRRETPAGPVEIFARRSGAGAGPPLVLLHGFPQTGAMWAEVARGLATARRVIVPDLRGYGASTGPAGAEAASKRAMGGDVLALLDALGIETFDLAGHDRGGRVAYRLALDLVAAGGAARLRRLALLDILPTIDYWERMNDRAFALNVYHWSFLAQPYPFPETLIAAAGDTYVDDKLARWSAAGDLSAFAPGALAAYRANARDPRRLRAMCDDYRAGASVDAEHDAADRSAGRRIASETLVLWGGAGIATKAEGPLGVWRSWCEQATGRAIPCGHFLPEERPAETLAALEAFFAA